MTGENQTLADIFTGQKLLDRPFDLFAENDIEKTATQAALASADVAHGQISALIGPAIGELLDIPISKIVAKAWTKLNGLQEFAHGDKFSSGETYDFPLAQHSITSTHEPSVELYVGDHRIAEAKLNIELNLLVARAQLKISEGYIRHIQISGLKMSGRISCHGVEIAKLERSDFEQTLSFDLGAGMKIPEWPV